MVRFRRNYVPGGTYFFTVTLRDRRSRALTDHIDLVRCAFRDALKAQPFRIDAIVVLPEHLHTVLTLPENDSDYSRRWQRIKGTFSKSLARLGSPCKRTRAASTVSGGAGSGSTPFAMSVTWKHT